jgi:hypothetical protein
VNPWKVQPEYRDDFDKIKTLEVELFQGMVMFIPAYWWYSIQFIGSETSVCSFKYRTHMNTLSIAPQLSLNLLQNMNIKRDTLEKRAIVKSQFQETTTTTTTAATAAIPSEQQQQRQQTDTTTPEYTSSVDLQYLPKSLRVSNPYSIMNAVTENVSSSSSSSKSMDNNNDLETSIAAAAIVTTPPISNEIQSQTAAASTASTASTAESAHL